MFVFGGVLTVPATKKKNAGLKKCAERCHFFHVSAEITSESVASGFALEIEASKLPSGKTNRRFWALVFSSRATWLQTSTALSDLCAFNRSTSSPSNPTQVRITSVSPSRRKSTCTTRSFPSIGNVLKSQTYPQLEEAKPWLCVFQLSICLTPMTECCIVRRNLNHK